MTTTNNQETITVNLLKGNCIEWMDKMINNGIQVDCIITSPPYDSICTYQGTCTWNFDIFKEIANRLFKLLRKGGVLCWVVADQVKDGSKTGTTARQALYFLDELKMKWNDTIIYEKNSSSFPASRKSKRYTSIYENVLIMTKGKIRDDIELLCDKPNKFFNQKNWGTNTSYDKDGNRFVQEDIKTVPEFSKRNNIWKYTTGCEKDKNDHPAKMPEKLCTDLLLSYSVKGDIVFDPFLGSGTTAKSAILNGRNAVGCEIVDKYYDISKDRIEKYYEGNIIEDNIDNLK